jgi:endopolyphosphatase
LTEYRKRGVKTYLTGHVPPGKKFYYPSCNRRYTLWSHAFRDVILGHLYGHNNMDHFFLLDAKQALEEEEEAQMLKYLLYSDQRPDFSTFTDSELDILQRLTHRSPTELLDLPDTDFQALGTEEYLIELKGMFQAIPERPKPKGKSDKKRKKWEEKVREYEENYQVVQVSPSIIPAYFTAIRVTEYNISGLEGEKFERFENELIERTNWTEWWAQMDREIAEEQTLEHDKTIDESRGLTFQQSGSNPDRYFGDVSVLDSYRRMLAKKPKKPPPSPRLPPEPHKSAPRGPLYESQVFTPLRWEVHFVNLTTMNTLYEEDPERQWDYGKDLFRMEYSSDAAPYYMKDLTVGTWLDLGIKIGDDQAVNKSEMQDGWVSDSDGDYGDEVAKKKPKKGKGKKGKDKGKETDQETYWDVFLRRAFINSGHQLDFGNDIL